MAVIFPIVSTFDPKGVNQAQKSIGGLGKQANLLKAAFTGVGIAAVAKGLQSSVMAASMLSESMSKANTVFGKNAEAVQNWSKTTSKAFGVNRQAALEAAGTYGNLFRAFGLTEQQSYTMSTSLVELAADMASFNNVPIEDALLALRAGLSGETEPLKRFGVALNDQRLKLKATEIGLGTYKGMLPVAIKTQAAYALIMQDTALAQGDVARTSGGLANQLKFLKAGLEDAKAGFGEALLPAALSVVSAFNDNLLPAIDRITKGFQFEGAEGGLRNIFVEIGNVSHNATGLTKVIKDVILLLVGMKVALIALRIGPPIIAAMTSALTSMRIAAMYGTAGITMLGTALKTQLASTGIGLLVIAIGAIAAKFIEARLEAQALDKEITVLESNGATSFSRFGNNLDNRVTKKLNAASLAAQRLTDDLENAGIMDVKRKRTGYFGPTGETEVDPAAAAAAQAKRESAAQKKAAAAAKAAADLAKKIADNMAKQVAKATAIVSRALEKMNDKLTAARDKLQIAKDAFAAFRDGVRDSITGLINFSDAASSRTGNFLKNLRKQADSAVGFADKVKQLISMGLSETGIQQVLAAGADAGGKIANELIAGGAGAIEETNKLLASVSLAAQTLAQAGADQFYKAGITQGQAMVDGIIAGIKAAGFVISGGVAALPKPLRNALSAGKLTSGQASEIMNLVGNSQAVTANNRSAQGTTINLTVNAGMGANGTTIGKDIVDAIKKYERTSGPVFLSA
jgi:hypothetical protein